MYVIKIPLEESYLHKAHMGTQACLETSKGQPPFFCVKDLAQEASLCGDDTYVLKGFNPPGLSELGYRKIRHRYSKPKETTKGSSIPQSSMRSSRDKYYEDKRELKEARERQEAEEQWQNEYKHYCATKTYELHKYHVMNVHARQERRARREEKHA